MRMPNAMGLWRKSYLCFDNITEIFANPAVLHVCETIYRGPFHPICNKSVTFDGFRRTPCFTPVSRSGAAERCRKRSPGEGMFTEKAASAPQVASAKAAIGPLPHHPRKHAGNRQEVSKSACSPLPLANRSRRHFMPVPSQGVPRGGTFSTGSRNDRLRGVFCTIPL